MSKQATDAAFFDMIHTLVQEQIEEDLQGANRRQSERHDYSCIQLLAPYDGKRLPAQCDFFKVYCQDISATGFAYYVRQMPETKFVIVALGAIPFMFYSAEIVHTSLVNNDGMVEYLVGCKLLDRIQRETSDI